MGGGTKIEQPAAPTATSSMTDYINNYPRLFELMQQYAPQEAAMNVGLTQQYALPMAQALKGVSDTLYPNETALTNQLTAKVQEGMNGQLPAWARQQYLDTQKSLLGENALSGAGADYMSTGLLNTQKEWNDYYTNLGLSITGRQPIYTGQQTGYTNQLGGYTPSSVAGFNSNIYGTAGNIYSSQLANQQSNPWASIGGSILGAGLGGMTGGWGTTVGSQFGKQFMGIG